MHFVKIYMLYCVCLYLLVACERTHVTDTGGTDSLIHAAVSVSPCINVVQCDPCTVLGLRQIVQWKLKVGVIFAANTTGLGTGIDYFIHETESLTTGLVDPNVGAWSELSAIIVLVVLVVEASGGCFRWQRKEDCGNGCCGVYERNHDLQLIL